ncbi:MAG: N-acetylneuraminate synthase [Bacteroidales bacterium]|nr:N-acetylneuraminate synthase [Bacteroidales bacterium]
MVNKTIVIAEAGVNHNGSFELAKKLIGSAADAGADYVKFQTFNASRLVSKSAKKAKYQQLNTVDDDDSQYSMLKKLEMPEEWYYKLKEYAEERGILFLSTGFDIESIDFLDKLGINFFKIPSGEITNKPYLQHIAKKAKEVIISTGMADITEIRNALEVIYSEGLPKEKITLLHCNTEYPTPMCDVNLLAMQHIKNEFGVKVGYSDHTQGVEVAIAAVALGASVIEKHFTLDRNLPGPDHKASLEPDELKSMVESIRNIELAISGSGLKTPSPSEKKNINIARKSLHYSNALSKGNVIKKDDLIAKRPGNGVSPMDIDFYIGKTLISDVEEEQMLKSEDFK